MVSLKKLAILVLMLTLNNKAHPDDHSWMIFGCTMAVGSAFDIHSNYHTFTEHPSAFKLEKRVSMLGSSLSRLIAGTYLAHYNLKRIRQEKKAKALKQ